jgi:hypothetical protein
VLICRPKQQLLGLHASSRRQTPVMSDDYTLANYARDLGPLLLDEVERARARIQEAEDETWADGVFYGTWLALSLLMSQADAFEIPRRDLGLPDGGSEELLTRERDRPGR